MSPGIRGGAAFVRTADGRDLVGSYWSGERLQRAAQAKDLGVPAGDIAYLLLLADCRTRVRQGGGADLRAILERGCGRAGEEGLLAWHVHDEACVASLQRVLDSVGEAGTVHRSPEDVVGLSAELGPWAEGVDCSRAFVAPFYVSVNVSGDDRHMVELPQVCEGSDVSELGESCFALGSIGRIAQYTLSPDFSVQGSIGQRGARSGHSQELSSEALDQQLPFIAKCEGGASRAERYIAVSVCEMGGGYVVVFGSLETCERIIDLYIGK
jgi:hypothetical protein